MNVNRIIKQDKLNQREWAVDHRETKIFPQHSSTDYKHLLKADGHQHHHIWNTTFGLHHSYLITSEGQIYY